MPNTKSALKRTRSTERKLMVNRAIKSRIGTLERKFNESVKQGNKEEVTQALKNVASAYDKAAKKGVVHRNKANNKKSRLTRKANALS